MSIANTQSKFEKIHDFVVSLKDKDTAIRATDQTLSKNAPDANTKTEEGKKYTHLYVRTGLFSKFWQKITCNTNGAIQKQQMAKNLIFSALNSLPADVKNNSIAGNSINNIKSTLSEKNLKDFTAGMIEYDLDIIRRTLTMININPLFEDPTSSDVGIPDGDDALSQLDSDSHDEIGAVLSSESKSPTHTASEKITTQEQEKKNEELAKKFDEILKRRNLGKYKTQENNTDTKSNDVTPANPTASIEVGEVVLYSLDPEVDGKPAEDTNSSPADTAPAINITPGPIVDAFEQDMVATEIATKSTPSPAPSAPSSTAKPKPNATDNPYLKSLKTEWNAKNGVYEVSKPFHITYDVPASRMIAQAYLLPFGRQLKLPGNTKKSSGEGSFVIKNAEAPKSSRVGGNKLIVNQRTTERLDKIREELFNIYLDSFIKISSEYKELNLGKELDTLVIIPISSVPETLADIESVALANALHTIQRENPNLKIVVSADKATHAAKIQADYENIVSKSV